MQNRGKLCKALLSNRTQVGEVTSFCMPKRNIVITLMLDRLPQYKVHCGIRNMLQKTNT